MSLGLNYGCEGPQAVPARPSSKGKIYVVGNRMMFKNVVRTAKKTLHHYRDEFVNVI
jgi:hypothetical protein